MRTPWRSEFPDVVIHTTVNARDTHACYEAAKSGDAKAAFMLARDLLNDDAVSTLASIIGGRAGILLPVVADETSGFNAIPDAMAQVLAASIGIEAKAGEIVQTNKVGHTRALAFQRLVTPAMFGGVVEAGRCYALVDDHVGLGGTLANLKGYLEAHGATVLAMTTLTESRDGRQFRCFPRRKPCYGAVMARTSTPSGAASPATELSASPKSKPKSYVVSHPLSPSRISWLRQQSKHAAAVSNRLLAEQRG